MQDFQFYFGLGWEHIISKDALDHQLFIAALAAIYLLRDWKQVLILGHRFYDWSFPDAGIECIGYNPV